MTLQNNSTLRTLFDRYQTDLKRYVAHKFGNHHDAEDIIQDTFHNVLKAENLDSIENPKAYLYQTAHNLALNRIRKQKRHEDYACSNVSDIETETVPLERSASATQDLLKLEQTMQNLPEKYRRTFLLSRVDGLTYAEIASELGISVSTVEKHIIKVLGHLRKQLQREQIS